MKFEISLNGRVNGLDRLLDYLDNLASECNNALTLRERKVAHISVHNDGVADGACAVSFWAADQTYLCGFHCIPTCTGWKLHHSYCDEGQTDVECVKQLYKAIVALNMMYAESGREV